MKKEEKELLELAIRDGLNKLCKPTISPGEAFNAKYFSLHRWMGKEKAFRAIAWEKDAKLGVVVFNEPDGVMPMKEFCEKILERLNQ